MTLTQQQPKKIYIRVDERRWQPNANTLLYLPLESDIADYSWNNRDVSTNSWMTQSTVWGKACYVVGNKGGINLWTWALSWIKPSTNQFTFNLWIYVSSTSSPNRCYFEWAIYQQYRLYLGRVYSTKEPRFLVIRSGSDRMTVMNNSAWDNKWSLITFTINDGTVNFYIDGVKDSNYPIMWVDNHWFWEFGGSSPSEQRIWLFNTRNGLNSSDAANCAVSSCIMESVARTDQQILDYYNQNKADYGL